MEIKEISNESFEKEVLNFDKPVLVDFNANWCGPCRMLKPVLEELSNSEDYKIVSVNVDTEEDIVMKYEIASIPCLILFKDGKEVARSVGFKSKDEIESMLGGN